MDNRELIARLATFVEGPAPTKPKTRTAKTEDAKKDTPQTPPKTAEPPPSSPSATSPKPASPPVSKTRPTTRLPPEKPAHPPPPRNTADEHRPAPSSTRLADSFVRIDVSVLDHLMTLVGELVLARNQILQVGQSIEHPAFAAGAQRLNLITSELQEGVMKTRMQPIRNVWNKLPRIIRDLSVSCGKQLRVEMHGKETELDRTILEAIKDPITHLVRNAVDHGIETPDLRAAAGKPKTGTLSFRANHEGGQVNIEISDDGRGIDVGAIRRKAAHCGLATAEHLARMADREVAMLIFEAGLSTAEKVTNVSGRGVGMDVVRTNIEKIGGSVDLQTRMGVGTTVKIKIPLTLAIIPALVITCGGQRYAIPQVNLLELVRLPGAQAQTAIEYVKDTPVYRQRGRLLPLVFLRSELRQGAAELNTDGDDGLNIVVLSADDRPFGLVVDGIHDTEEIVVKPLGNHLKSISVFAGTTIMGDGAVALILDVLGIAEQAGVISDRIDTAVPLAPSEDVDGTPTGEAQTLLLFRVGQDRRMALPLSMAARLEEFSLDRMEQAAGQTVVQYRGALLPLIDLRQEFGREKKTDKGRSIQVVVYANADQSFGLVVDRIEDIVEETIHVSHPVKARGIDAAAVVRGAVTEIVDVRGLIRHSAGAFAIRSAS